MKYHPDVDYDALANCLESRCTHATTFLRIHLLERKTGVNMTSLRTLYDKLAANYTPVTPDRAERILQLYSELGLGTLGKRYNRPMIQWNPEIDLAKLAHCLDSRAHAVSVIRKMQPIDKGEDTTCYIPAGSYAALMATGLGQCLGIRKCVTQDDDDDVDSEPGDAKPVSLESPIELLVEGLVDDDDDDDLWLM